METLNKMRGKTKISTIALVLVLTIAASLVALPAATAQRTQKTYAYLGAVPNPVGAGQTVLLHVGITQQLQIVGDGWENLTVTIERPDGTNETLGPIRTDSTGGTGVTYTPANVGTYYLQTHFPEQMFRRVLYLASVSEKLALVVQEEPIPYHPYFPLPTEYWTRPIDAQLREWSAISGSWLSVPDNLFAPYNDGPESAHILWAKPFTMGGVAGGELGPQGFECGDAYEGKWEGSLIIAGRLYYRTGAYDRPRVYHCVDLHTGEELWSRTFLDNATISFGQLFYWDSYNYHGVFPYLWIQSGPWRGPFDWHAFDPFTGEWRFTIENVPSGTTLYGSRGEIYRLQIDLRRGWMALWNMSAVISMAGSWGSAAHLRTHNGDRARAWSWNVTIPTGLPGSVQVSELGDRVIGGSITRTEVELWGLSLKPEQEGSSLFNNTWKAPAEWVEGNLTISGFSGGWKAWSLEDKVGVMWIKETREHYGFSLETGDCLWGPTPSQYYLDALEDTPENARHIAYGRFYSASVGGVAYCYNVTTGELLWTYEAEDPYQEILWANNWWLRPLFITDGKIYLGHGEHSAIDPKPRGAPFICLNATTGDVIFRVDGLFRSTRWGGRAIIGDSIIATQDTYDQRVYAIGKGPTATEVSALPKIIANGDSVMIEGTVMDVSPGTKEPALTARFPNGVPAIADENMSEWMLYVYKQFPHPADVVGVPVTLDAVDQNGTWIHIDTVTSDASGLFSYMWTPPDEGPYTIIATFMGSKSYYASYAATGLGVGPEPPAPPQAAEAPAYTAIDLAIIAAVAVAIVIGLVNLYALRKRK